MSRLMARHVPRALRLFEGCSKLGRAYSQVIFPRWVGTTMSEKTNAWIHRFTPVRRH
jgi:hypothetical protein